MRRILAILTIAAKRLLAQPGLAMATILGQVVAIALTMSIPIYSDAVYYQTFLRKVAPGGAKSPLTFVFKAGGDLQGPSEWEDIQSVDHYLTAQTADMLGLPQKLGVRFFQTRYYDLHPDPAVPSQYTSPDETLAPVRLAALDDLEQHVTILEGVYPGAAGPGEDSIVEVLASDQLALKLGLQVGERFVVSMAGRTANGVQPTAPIPVAVAGIWQAVDPLEEYWPTGPDLLSNYLFVPEETFAGRIAPYVSGEVYVAMWYFVMDGAGVDNDDAGPLLERINIVERQAKHLLPAVTLDVSPRGELKNYQTAAALLTVLLYAFSAPIVGLFLAFISITASLAVEQRRNEIAVLRSRGSTSLQLVGIAAVEGLLLGIISLAVGAPLSRLVARALLSTRSFLDFQPAPDSDIRISLTTPAIAIGIVTVGVALIAQLAPTVRAARHTVTSYKQERARWLARAWWQRIGLDGLLLIPTLYGAFLLHQQGAVVVFEDKTGRGLFQNPLLFFVPTLGVLAITLFILRLVPALVGLIGWAAAQTKSVALLIAARHLSRTPGFYDIPFLLLVLTLSLSVFTASLALTLDSHLYDRVHYQNGADISFSDFGEVAETSQSGEANSLDWRFLPVSAYLETPGVRSAARVGKFPAYTSMGGGRQHGTFLGIDRYEFAQSAFWRKDFAPESLEALTNALALEPDAVLVSGAFMREHLLNVNDTVRVVVELYGESYEFDLRIVGGVDLFPGWYPEDGPLFVGNLDYLFELAGGQFPYSVWLSTDRPVQPDEVPGRPIFWRSAASEIARAQQQPERQGLFGILSVGFVAAAALTALGFLLYMAFSFRRRFIEVGVMRAIGLSVRQMMGCVAWELAFLVLIGGVAGTALGVAASTLFIPYLQVGVTPEETIPPFLVSIAWQDILRIYFLLGLLFLIMLGVLAVLLWRTKIFEAIKLGETV
ncbi:MAG: FtsX-like permease family protein [Anaerolineae bacterium]|nr:FtsX-like permease family protein [Anaerolineae bacterium]